MCVCVCLKQGITDSLLAIHLVQLFLGHPKVSPASPASPGSSMGPPVRSTAQLQPPPSSYEAHLLAPSHRCEPKGRGAHGFRPGHQALGSEPYLQAWLLKDALVTRIWVREIKISIIIGGGSMSRTFLVTHRGSLP